MSFQESLAATGPSAEAPLLVALRGTADWTAVAGWLKLQAERGRPASWLGVGPSEAPPPLPGALFRDADAWQEAVHYGEPLIAALQAAIMKHRADLVLAPSPTEPDPARRALSMACIEAVKRLGAPLRLALYEWSMPGRPGVVVDISAAWTWKQQLLADAGAEGRALLALNRFRGQQARPPVDAAEAFELVDAVDLAAGRSALFDSSYLRLAAQGQPGDGALDLPLVSVLVRSMGLPLLQQALDSVSRQTYDAIEVVVVNASGQPHPPLPPRCGRFGLRLVEPGTPLARAAAANRAVAEARGDWLIFLDDDDLFDAGHVARLRAALAAQPRATVAYAGVRLQHADGRPAGELDEPFDPVRLWFANHLPIHAVMFARRLVSAAAPFDEQLAVYEDWDFWHRLARGHTFLHVPGVSATYRLLGQSGLTRERDEALSRNARRAIYRQRRRRAVQPGGVEPACACCALAGRQPRGCVFEAADRRQRIVTSDRVPQLLDAWTAPSVLRPGENLGFLRAVNLAAARARGRHLLLLNNDAMLEPDTLRHAVARLDGDAGIGAVGGPILLWDGRLQEAGSIVWRDGSCQGYGRGDDPVRPEYGFVRDVDYCSGAFLMVRRTLFEALGGLDTPSCPAYYEETDFCVRLWEAGHRIVYDPRVRIRHFEFASEVGSAAGPSSCSASTGSCSCSAIRRSWRPMPRALAPALRARPQRGCAPAPSACW
jgi:GT2 family glycosyltransferase